MQGSGAAGAVVSGVPPVHYMAGMKGMGSGRDGGHRRSGRHNRGGGAAGLRARGRGSQLRPLHEPLLSPAPAAALAAPSRGLRRRVYRARIRDQRLQHRHRLHPGAGRLRRGSVRGAPDPHRRIAARGGRVRGHRARPVLRSPRRPHGVGGARQLRLSPRRLLPPQRLGGPAPNGGARSPSTPPRGCSGTRSPR